MKERRFNRSVAYASSSLEADPNAATIVAAPFTSVPPPEFGGEGIVVFVDLDPRVRWIRKPFFGAPAIAVLIANHSGACPCCQSNSAENSQTAVLK
jgi:hypothetical protein